MRQKMKKVEKGTLFTKNLTSTEYAAQPVKDCFVCPLCIEVVKRPVKCSSCEKLFCGACIDTWLKTRAKTE